MSDLEDKLRGIDIIRTEYTGGGEVRRTIELNDDEIAQIKDVLEQSGYINWRTLPKGIYNHSGRSFTQISADTAHTPTKSGVLENSDE